MVYYRNAEQRYGSYNVAELTNAGHDSRAFFTGAESEKTKQDILNKLIETATAIVDPLRRSGHGFSIGRSYSEGAANHSTGYALDLVPPGRTASEAYSLAKAVEALGRCSQIWIEASDDAGNFHVHVRYSTNSIGLVDASKVDLKTITGRDGSGVQTGLVLLQQQVKDAEAGAADVQDAKTVTPEQSAKTASGIIIPPGHAGNQSVTTAGQNFMDASSSGGGLGSVVDVIRGFISDSGTGTISGKQLNRKNNLDITNVLQKEVLGVATKISQLSNIRVEDAEDFLYILITCDQSEVMTKFATVTDISELADPSIIGQPFEILAIPNIEKVAHLADAISAILRAYRQYAGYENHCLKSKSTSYDDMMSSIVSGLGIAQSVFSVESGGISQGNMMAGGAGSILGPLMTKLLKGKEVPMGIQANNPMLQSRNMLNTMLFGAATSSTHAFDNDMPFPKPIAVFGDMVSGAGSSSFNMKNQGTMNTAQPLDSIITKVSSSVFNVPVLSSLQQLSNELGGITDQVTPSAVNVQTLLQSTTTATSLPAQLVKNMTEVYTTVDPNDTKGRKVVKSGEVAGDIAQQLGTNAQQKKTSNKPPAFVDVLASGIKEMVTGSLGAQGSSQVEMSRADNAVPVQSAMANAMNGLQDMMPKINSEYRRQLEQVAGDIEKLSSATGNMVNLDSAIKLGLNPSTAQIPSMLFGSSLQAPKVVPTEMFQQGWQQMCSVNQELSKDSKFWQQVMLILNNIS